jgi:hypothetical protein
MTRMIEVLEKVNSDCENWVVLQGRSLSGPDTFFIMSADEAIEVGKILALTGQKGLERTGQTGPRT